MQWPTQSEVAYVAKSDFALDFKAAVGVGANTGYNIDEVISDFRVMADDRDVRAE